MSRKTANDYQREYVDKVSKLEGLEARIKARAEQLCKEHPDAPIGAKILNATGKDLKTLGEMSTESYIFIIKNIEDHNAKKAGIVQTTMFPKT